MLRKDLGQTRDVENRAPAPGGGKETGGLKEYAPALVRAAAATASVDGFFLEVDDHPDQALSDRTTQLDVALLADLDPIRDRDRATRAGTHLLASPEAES